MPGATGGATMTAIRPDRSVVPARIGKTHPARAVAGAHHPTATGVTAIAGVTAMATVGVTAIVGAMVGVIATVGTAVIAGRA